jgi:type I restriction enzyme, S subunit
VTKWRTVTLGDVVELKRGYDLPTATRRDGTVPIISSSGRTGFHDEAKVSGPGVVTGRYGTLGEVFYVEEDFWPLNTALYVRDFKGNNPRFVAALLASLDLGRRDGAAAVPGLNRNHLHVLPVTIPDPQTQARIAEVLFAFDGLVENNRRRTVLLERMAHEIYREWFVRYRYPGYESDALSESPIGSVPSSWEVIAIGDIVTTLGGGTPSKKESAYWEGGAITWFTPSDLTKARAMFIGSSSARITEAGLAGSSARLFPAHSVLMTSRATIGVISITTVESCTNQGFIVCVPNERLTEIHLYFWLRENVQHFESLATGATFKEITRGAFRKIPIAVPPRELEARFAETVAPIAESVERLNATNELVVSMRDLLLPRLMSGAIDVSRLDLDALVAESPR